MTVMVLGCSEHVRSGIKLTNELRSKVAEARAETEQISEDDKDNTVGDFDRVLLWILHTDNLGERVHPIPRT